MVQVDSDCQTMNIIKTFVSESRQKMFEWRLNREIFRRISPHIAGEGDFG